MEDGDPAKNLKLPYLIQTYLMLGFQTSSLILAKITCSWHIAVVLTPFFHQTMGMFFVFIHLLSLGGIIMHFVLHHDAKPRASSPYDSILHIAPSWNLPHGAHLNAQTLFSSHAPFLPHWKCFLPPAALTTMCLKLSFVLMVCRTFISSMTSSMSTKSYNFAIRSSLNWRVSLLPHFRGTISHNSSEFRTVCAA